MNQHTQEQQPGGFNAHNLFNLKLWGATMSHYASTSLAITDLQYRIMLGPCLNPRDSCPHQGC